MSQVLRAVLSVTAVVLAACSSGDATGEGGPSPGSSAVNDPAQPESAPPPPTPKPSAGESAGFKYAFTPNSVGIKCGDPASKLRASGAAMVAFGESAIVAGYEQISANDQDPIVARLDGDVVSFCEHTKKGGGPDARAYGITWDGRDTLYGVFTVVGGGTAFDAAAKGGWMASYGDGGASAKVMVIGKLDVKTGVLERATYVPAKVVKSGQSKTNTLTPADAVHVLADGSLEIFGNAAFCSLNPDKTTMCADNGQDYPKNFRARFSADLREMQCASAIGVSFVKTPCK